LLALKTKLTASSRARGYRRCLHLLVVVACFGVAGAYGQSPGLRVPVLVLPSIETTDMPMVPLGGIVVNATEVDRLSYYQRSRLGRWKVAKDVDPDDAVFGIELKTAARTIRIRLETTINGQPFRAAREKTIDELLAIANGTAEPEDDDVEKDADEKNTKEEQAVEEIELEEIEEQLKEQLKEQLEEQLEEQVDAQAEVAEEAAEPEKKTAVAFETFVASSDRDRMVTYARSRGAQLSRYELRRRVAEIAGGPALLRTNSSFGANRHQTMTLFAFLDADQDGVISSKERDGAVDKLNHQDVDSNGKLTINELQLGLKAKSSHRDTGSTKVEWKPWDAVLSHDVEDINVQVSFSDDAKSSGLRIGDCRLDESWDLIKVDTQRAKEAEPEGPIVMLSHPKVAVTLSAVQMDGETNTDQISVGVTLEPNALFRAIDQDGNGILSTSELRSCDDMLASLDTNASGTLEASELPVLLRVCVARGAIAHETLTESVSIIRYSKDKNNRKLEAPEWFASMDEDGDRKLTRDEFLGGRKSFNKMDTDKNDLLSVEEGLAENPD